LNSFVCIKLDCRWFNQLEKYLIKRTRIKFILFILIRYQKKIGKLNWSQSGLIYKKKLKCIWQTLEKDRIKKIEIKLGLHRLCCWSLMFFMVVLGIIIVRFCFSLFIIIYFFMTIVLSSIFYKQNTCKIAIFIKMVIFIYFI